jgi:Kef-type K+ transport system membrane component KefB
MHASAIVLQISLAIVIAAALAFGAKALRQPLILAYIAAGLIAGPSQGLGMISPEAIEPVSELGLILLLFMIGLEIDLNKLRREGVAVALVGVLQFPACVAIGVGLFSWMGLGGHTRYGALYLAVGAALSSTMIVVKLLHDKQELDTLPGRITLATLVCQDIWAILFLALQPNLEDPRFVVLAGSLVKVVLLFAFAFLIAKYVLPAAFRFVARLPEAMLIGSLAWCFLVAIIAAQLELSLEMGALIAGVAVSTFPYNVDVTAKILGLRDFFVTLFFVVLGAKIAQPTWALFGAALVGAVIVILTRFLTVSPILYAMRRGNRASFIPALNLAQVSEFSIVIGSMGVALGHIAAPQLGTVVFMMLITAVASTYFIQYNHEIFTAVHRRLQRLGLRDNLGGRQNTQGVRTSFQPVMLIGFWRVASSLLHELLARDPALATQVRVIDLNPDVREELQRRRIAVTYGDVAHAETLAHASIEMAEVLVCTLPDSVLRGITNLNLLRHLRALAPNARTIMTAERFDEAEALYAAGAAFVYIPRLHSARDLAEIVQLAMSSDLAAPRAAALDDIRDRAEVMA